MALSASAVAGNCTYPDDIAADGSICGGRAASVRPGGYEPPPEYPAPQTQAEREMAAIAAANADEGLTDVFCFHAEGNNFKQADSNPVHFQIQEKGDIHKVAIIEDYRKEFNWYQNRTDANGTSHIYIAPTDDNGKTIEVLDLSRKTNRIIVVREKGSLTTGKPISLTRYTCPLN